MSRPRRQGTISIDMIREHLHALTYETIGLSPVQFLGGGDMERATQAANWLVSQRKLNYTKQQFMTWLDGTVPGTDVTLLLHGDRILGVTIGYFWVEEMVYLTHITQVASGSSNSGIGKFLRQKQIESLYTRIGRPFPCTERWMMPLHGEHEKPLRVVSYSANPDVPGWQTYVFTKVMDLTQSGSVQALPILQRLDTAVPGLMLRDIMSQDVTPMLFIDD